MMKTQSNTVRRTGQSLRTLVVIASITVGAFFAQPVVVRAEEPAESGNLQQTTTKTMETFVPAHTVAIASIELQPEVTVNGGEVTLKQLCRWPEGDAEMIAAYADLVIVRMKPGTSFSTVSVDQIQSLLRDAGMNPGSVNFAGAASCTVTRSDVKVDEAEALRDWMTNSQGAIVVADATQSTSTPAPADAASQAPAEAKGDAGTSATTLDIAPPAAPVGDLRAQLITDIATRLNLRPDTLQVDFSPEDRKVLVLRPPLEFRIEPQRSGDLGDVSWLVTIANGTESKRIRIAAHARSWIDQVVTVRAIGMKQTISEADIEPRRILADKLPADVLVTKDQIIGQQAARDLKAGAVLTSKLLAPMELVRPGQLVTVLMRRGAIEVKSVARALQSGSAGQTVKVKNEATNTIFQVTLTGPQTGLLAGSDPVADASN